MAINSPKFLLYLLLWCTYIAYINLSFVVITLQRNRYMVTAVITYNKQLLTYTIILTSTRLETHIEFWSSFYRKYYVSYYD